MRALLVLGVLSLAGLFVGLGRIDWMDAREARDAWIARDLVQRRELLTPSLGGVPRFEKPLLAYGLEIAAASLTPDSPAGPRAVKAALAVALVVLTAWIGARHLGARAGAIAGVVLATSLALPVASRSDGTQLFATLLGWLAWAGLAKVALGHPSRARLASYALMAILLVVAGPFPAFWPLAAVVLHARRHRIAEKGPSLGALAGFLFVVGWGLPWYGAMLERHGAPFALALPAFPYGGEPGSPWYVAPARAIGFMVVGFFPWSALLPAAALYRWTGEGGSDFATNRVTDLLTVTLLTTLVPLLFAPAAPIPAILPALPAAAMLTGALLDRVFTGEALAARATAQASWLIAGSGTVAALMLAWIARRLELGAPELRLMAAFLFLVSWAPALASFIGRVRAVPALITLVVAAGTPLAAWKVLPALEDRLSAGPVASAMNQVSAPAARLLVLEPPPVSLRMRLERPLAFPRSLVSGLRELRGEDGWTYVAFTPRRQSEVARAAAPAPLEILARSPMLVLARVGKR
ncbi:MAG TPA: hypothetical protein VFQ05_09845 [Candidatus Eisenbacteria bacterium]|nr:hypothetical protein [Candidatus Eisenbacteria bacterium]